MCQIVEKKKEDFCILTIPHSHSPGELCNNMQKNQSSHGETMGFGEIYVVRAAPPHTHTHPSGLSQRCVNSDPTMLGKGQLSLLGSIRSEENTEREGKSGLKW